jgi:superoxide dismutase, Fe-Mn family
MTQPAEQYQMKKLACDPDKLVDLSNKLITSHYENNYGGAVKRLINIRKQLAQIDWAQAPNYVINGIKREELIAANSAFLHELYFDCLGGTGELKLGGLSVGIARDFGSFERWKSEFTALAKAMGGGSGWAMLSWSAHENRLVNHWAADHTHMLGGAAPLLALDMYEHAYHLDFGANAGAYVEAFMRNIHWDNVNEHYADAVAAGAGSLAVSCAEVAAGGMPIIDVRRAGAFKASPSVVAGATWMDPERVYEWASSLPRSQPVVVYCVYGHEVCQSTAAILRMLGIEAKYLAGGIDAWKTAGLPLSDKGE